MGCSPSQSAKPKQGIVPPAATKPAALPTTPPAGGTPKAKPKSRLSKEEVESRISAPKVALQKDHAGLNMQFAWVSQRGYYPNDLNKPNQDSYTVLSNFDENMAFFAVYDGHGPAGHLCAWFVRDNLPKAILSELKNYPQTSSGISKALTKAHNDVNIKLHHTASIDDELSGTTSISILMVGKTLYVSNVGDSRAIIMSERVMSPGLEVGADIAAATAKTRLSARPLSSDQTPYRSDERERVIRRGARILTQDQIDGVKPITDKVEDLNLGDAIDEDGDPPRVWSTKGDYPGTAFTRSFGDSIAESIGVIAEPEILVRELNHDDRYLVVASDGVFEFITNQMVSDMITLYSDNPLSACKIVVSAAYELWLQYETRTDDITIIVIYLGNSSSEADDDVIGVIRRGSTLNVISEDQIRISEIRPVRRGMSREKKKKVIVSVSSPNSETDMSDSEFNPKHVSKTKSDEELATISNALMHNFLFHNLTPDVLEAVVHAMSSVSVTAGRKVIRQGEEGDKFYVVKNGTFEVRVKLPGEASEIESSGDGEVVATYEAGKDLHPCFGDLALLYGQPRAATVIAITDGELWALERNVFRAVMRTLSTVDPTRELTRALRKLPLFQPMNLPQLQRMVKLFKEVVYSQGDIIVKQGQIASGFYLVLNGSCEKMDMSTSPPTRVKEFCEYDCFGEDSLMDEVSLSTSKLIRASSDIKLLCITRDSFEETFGSLQEVIDVQLRRRESFSKGLASNARLPSMTLDSSNLLAIVDCDASGPLMLGHFSKTPTASNLNSVPNITIRSFLLSEVEKLGMSGMVRNFMLTVRTIVAYNSVHTSDISLFLPKYQSVLRNQNAIHLLFSDPIIGDLEDVIQKFNKSCSSANPTMLCDESVVVYILSCVITALEALHSMGIVYRSIQPEGLHVTAEGKVVLLDYSISKVGGVGARTYTVCGAKDYLAPEQIANSGHGAPVDLWALGVLAFELICGCNPFTASTEMGIFKNITTFGSPSFRALRFTEHCSMSAVDLISQLISVDPDSRLGAGIGGDGFSKLRKHEFFSSVTWPGLSEQKSPLVEPAAALLGEISREGIDLALVAKFSLNYTGTRWDEDLES